MESERTYKLIYLLPISSEEKAAEEFQQKLETEITERGGQIKHFHKNKQHMVRTKRNRGARGIYLVTLYFALKPEAKKEIERFLHLAQGTVINHMILRLEAESTSQKLPLAS